jgi:hypothetical protein
VNLGKLKRTLERDFKRNPAKTGVLLALLPVAAYFIGPLFWKMIPKTGSDGATVGSVALPAANSLVPPANATSPRAAPWHEVAAQIASDSRMTSAAVAGLRDPFQGEEKVLVQLAEQPIEPAQEVTEDPNEETRPEDFGLQLTATIVGEHLRLATINGKQYRENAKLPILQSAEGAPNDIQGGAAFVVKRVAKKYVVLEREGKLYQLQLSR